MIERFSRAVKRLRLLLLGLLLMAPSPASAWWDYGHRTVAGIAKTAAKPATMRAVRRLIGQSGALGTPECPVRSIEEASEWADCIKKLGDRFDYAVPWHFQNISICKPFDPTAACAEGNCVSAQIERQARRLADRSLPARERVMALAFVVHLVGDLHMPLHASDRGDKGGGDLPASYGAIGGRTNLHIVWDGYLAERAISTPPGGVGGLIRSFDAASRRRMKEGTVEDWTRESWEVGRELAYGSVLADSCAGAPATRPVVDEAVTQRLIPVVRLQIARAGLRLARILDEALG